MLRKAKLNTIEVLISRSLIDSYISHDKFVSANNKVLLTGETNPELHFKQPGFTYSACGPYIKHRERIQKFRETGTLKHL